MRYSHCTHRFVAASVLLLGISACSETDDGTTDASTDSSLDASMDAALDARDDARLDARLDAALDADALPPGVTPSPDGEGYCCPMGAPSCECTPTGGFTLVPNGCVDFSVCDGHPDDWVLGTDAHGCDSYTVGTTTCCSCATDASLDIRVDFGNWATDPVGNWVLMPLGTMDTLFEGLVDFSTGMATSVSLDSDVEWISSGGDASNWTSGDVGWLPQVVAQDAWGGNIAGNTIRFAGVPGAVRVDVVAASGFPGCFRRSDWAHRSSAEGTAPVPSR